MAAKKPKYKAVIDTVGRQYKSQGDTILEAISGFPVEWNEIKGKGTITLTRGKDSYEHLFSAPQLRRLVGSKIVKSLWAKNFELLLKSEKTTNIPVRL